MFLTRLSVNGGIQMHLLRRLAVLSVTALPFLAVMPAYAITMKECSAKYEGARKSGTLNGMKWSDFRVSQCDLKADHNAVPSVPRKADGREKPAAASIEVPRGVTFPSSVDTRFAAETPARQRMKTCRKAYHDNKRANTLGGLRWLQRGGGYYSVCNARLKGSS